MGWGWGFALVCTARAVLAEEVVAEPAMALPGPSVARLPVADEKVDGLYVEFGRGVPLTPADSSFSLVLRGRLQLRAGYAGAEGPADEPDLNFQVRRARLVLLGDVEDRDLQLYLQLGFAPGDLEPDYEVPLRDAVVSWTRSRDLSVRVGQMKVPFSRQRLVSSSALQFADRAEVNAQLNLDRDVGLQLYSNDLFGWDHRLAYQVGVYGGDGRNRVSTGLGLLYVARVQFQPFGGFDDVFTEADLKRSPRPRLSLGAAGAVNDDTPRSRSTHGTVFEEGHDLAHGAADLLFKWRGWSVQSEALWRGRLQALPAEARPETAPRVGWGWMVQTGYLTAGGTEIAGRFTVLEGADDPVALLSRQQAHAALGRYLLAHDLKVQGDFGLTWQPEAFEPVPEARVQLQLFF